MANQLDGGDGPRWRRNQHLLEIALVAKGEHKTAVSQASRLDPVALVQSLISLCRCSLMAGVERPSSLRTHHTGTYCQKALPHHLGSDWKPRHMRRQTYSG